MWNTSKWLWIPIYNFLCLTCVISGVQSLGGLKNELRDSQNANKHAKYNILPRVRCVIATSHYFICGSSESCLSWQGSGETTQQPSVGPKGKKPTLVIKKGCVHHFDVALISHPISINLMMEIRCVFRPGYALVETFVCDKVGEC